MKKIRRLLKLKIVIPNWRVFTDYFLLLKYEGSWKIVHKSYTWREIPKKQKANKLFEIIITLIDCGAY